MTIKRNRRHLVLLIFYGTLEASVERSGDISARQLVQKLSKYNNAAENAVHCFRRVASGESGSHDTYFEALFFFCSFLFTAKACNSTTVPLSPNSTIVYSNESIDTMGDSV